MSAVPTPTKDWQTSYDHGISSGHLVVHGQRLERRRARAGRLALLRDLWELTKPNIMVMNVLMMAGAMALAPMAPSIGAVLFGLVGTALAVGSANALNMVIERRSDALMNRTRRRPIPDGRLSPTVATVFGIALGVVSMPVLAIFVNLLTAALGLIALLGYVLVYTPLKRRSPLALAVGTIPGAMPPLMGWTAATGRIDAVGLVLFGLLLVWQLPHFLAISIYNKSDYIRAGIKTVALARGDRAAKRQALISVTALLPVSLLLVPLGVAGGLYLVAAIGLGAWFWLVGLEGLRETSGTRWARRFFLVSIVYLPAIVIALAVDALVGL